MADRDGARLAEHEEKPQLTERQVVMGPIGRPLRHEPTQCPNVSLDVLQRNSISWYFGHALILWHVPKGLLKAD
jgi:hypothetical protein